MTTKSIATVGAGFSGTLPSLHLLRHCPPGTRVVLIERLAGPQPGGGAGRPPRVRRPGAHGRVPRRCFERVRRLLADGTVDPTPLITGTVGLDGVADAFESLADPARHAKILIDPASGVTVA